MDNEIRGLHAKQGLFGQDRKHEINLGYIAL